MTRRFKSNELKKKKNEGNDLGDENAKQVLVTWISRVLGIHRKLTTTDSFFINSEAISPSPAPWSQSRTKSRLVRIWTARDHENKPSDVGRNNEREMRLFLIVNRQIR